VHDALVWIGRGAERQQIRLISVLHNGTRQRYLTNALDPHVLPPEYAVALYYQRWRIENRQPYYRHRTRSSFAGARLCPLSQDTTFLCRGLRAA
jgi:hypothetical protein